MSRRRLLPDRSHSPQPSLAAVLLLVLLGLVSAVRADSRRTMVPPSWTPPQHRGETPHAAVVRVSVAERTGSSQGSGTLVEVRGPHGLVVTNWHVVRDAAGLITVTFPDGFRSAATVLKTDADWDLAALLIWRPQVSPVPIARRPPRPGELLSIAGFGAGQYRSASGPCTQYVAPGENFPYEMVELAAQARDGDSGGPIFNRQGELAGVLFGATQGVTSGSYCGRVSWFLEGVWGDGPAGDPPFHGYPSVAPPQQPLVAMSEEHSKPAPQGTHSSSPRPTLPRPASPRITPLRPATEPAAEPPAADELSDTAISGGPGRQYAEVDQPDWHAADGRPRPIPYSESFTKSSADGGSWSDPLSASPAFDEQFVGGKAVRQSQLGQFPLEHVKTFLALLGLLAVFARLGRWLAGGTRGA